MMSAVSLSNDESHQHRRSGVKGKTTHAWWRRGRSSQEGDENSIPPSILIGQHDQQPIQAQRAKDAPRRPTRSDNLRAHAAAISVHQLVEEGIFLRASKQIHIEAVQGKSRAEEFPSAEVPAQQDGAPTLLQCPTNMLQATDVDYAIHIFPGEFGKLTELDQTSPQVAITSSTDSDRFPVSAHLRKGLPEIVQGHQPPYPKHGKGRLSQNSSQETPQRQGQMRDQASQSQSGPVFQAMSSLGHHRLARSPHEGWSVGISSTPDSDDRHRSKVFLACLRFKR